MIIEKVTTDDTEELLKIYGPYVEKTAVSFEYAVPSCEEFKKRIETISSKYPYINAVDESGEILGYAYATAFKTRAAYDWSVESTVYVREDARRKGVGRALYLCLEDSLKNMGILNMNACIALPQKEDEHLTFDSIRFHEKMGFEKVGIFHSSGYKFNSWYDMIWMEKMLGTHNLEQKPVKFGSWTL